ncbi:unnamed protein product [Lactuca saligna]|uniref:Dynamin stalk domain-containing protein n=1 Tax=Lactuca saligna TaxID=75948 RepID=A0AA35W0D5_LACSI|nr:unnamed protein product [Lactuca saligna]
MDGHYEVGGSPARPQHVYELCFSHGQDTLFDACDFTKTKAVEGISRKEVDPFERLTDQDICTAIHNATGLRSALFVLEVPLQVLVRRQIAQLLDHVFNVLDLSSTFPKNDWTLSRNGGTRLKYFNCDFYTYMFLFIKPRVN